MNEVATILAILLILTNVLWGWNTHILLNKLMSRTFWEFKEATQIPKSKDAELKEALSNVKIPLNNGPNELDSLDQEIRRVMPFG